MYCIERIKHNSVVDCLYDVHTKDVASLESQFKFWYFVNSEQDVKFCSKHRKL